MLLSERDTGFLQCLVPLRTGWDLDKLLDGWGVCSPRFVCDGSAEGGKGEQSRLWGEDQCCSRRCSSGGSRARWVLLRLLLPASSEAVQCIGAPLAATRGPSSVHRTRPHWEALGASRDPVPWKMMPQKHETRTQNCEECVWMRSYMEY